MAVVGEGEAGGGVGEVVEAEEEGVVAGGRGGGDEQPQVVHYGFAGNPGGGEGETAAGFAVPLRDEAIWSHEVQKDLVSLFHGGQGLPEEGHLHDVPGRGGVPGEGVSFQANLRAKEEVGGCFYVRCRRRGHGVNHKTHIPDPFIRRFEGVAVQPPLY